MLGQSNKSIRIRYGTTESKANLFSDQVWLDSRNVWVISHAGRITKVIYNDPESEKDLLEHQVME